MCLFFVTVNKGKQKWDLQQGFPPLPSHRFLGSLLISLHGAFLVHFLLGQVHSSSLPSEHKELYIVYNCSLERTVLHEYSYIYFWFNLKCLCRVPYAEKNKKQIEELNDQELFVFLFECGLWRVTCPSCGVTHRHSGLPLVLLFKVSNCCLFLALFFCGG